MAARRNAPRGHAVSASSSQSHRLSTVPVGVVERAPELDEPDKELSVSKTW